jgi:glycosyltransferase involved in cell wall biosynthesis
LRIRFITATPLDVRRGSGTYVGIHVLARALEALGHHVDFVMPEVHLPVYTAQRLLFNRGLRPDPTYDLTVGFDLDGYRIAAEPGHIASLKGVIADEVRFERGLTRLTMGLQAGWERTHVNRAALVLTTSRYSAERAREYYGLADLPAIVPELIDLAEWRRHLVQYPAHSENFDVLFVGRFYRRKRVDHLLRAAALLRTRLPALRLRIVGNGPCTPALHKLAAHLKLENTVNWLGDVSRTQLVEEYNRASVFCMPSVQEGFGIVLLEAMAAGLPIVAASAGAIPEVVPHALLTEPESPEHLANALASLHDSPQLRREIALAGTMRVEQFDAPLIAARFLEAVGKRAISAAV